MLNVFAFFRISAENLNVGLDVRFLGGNGLIMYFLRKKLGLKRGSMVGKIVFAASHVPLSVVHSKNHV